MSSPLGTILLEKEILLESGTNELEILVFQVADCTFGINVAKVREVLPTQKFTALPRAHRSVRGVFKLRDRVIPVVSLIEHLNLQPTRTDGEARLILTDFNQQQTAFLVDEVEHIHRLSWERIQPVPGLVAMSNSPLTAVARIGERMIVMLDFEMVIDQVTERLFRQDAVENPGNLARESLRLFLVDDSPTVRQAVGATLRNSGYSQIETFENGAQAWQRLEAASQSLAPGETVCDLVISDVEMPQIDGFHLTKRIKQHPELKRIPVLLYSSIVTPDNLKKGKAVGADAQVSKPELRKVVEMADALICQSLGQPPSLSSAPPQAAPAAASPTPLTAQPPSAPPAPSAPPITASARQPAPPLPTAAQSSSLPVNAPFDRRLWATFHAELFSLATVLQEVCAAAAQRPIDGESLNRALRTLHTIKSAAMVVPVDAVTHATHAIESALEPVRKDPSLWPAATLDRYLEWLQELLHSAQPERVLARSPAIDSDCLAATVA